MNQKILRLKKPETAGEARKIISPTSDMFARYLLAGEGRRLLTESFINAVLEDSGEPCIQTVEIKSPFNLADWADDRETILDVKVADAAGSLYDIEIQNALHQGFFNRLALYWAQLYAGQAESGIKYENLCPCTVIALLHENIYHDLDKPHTCSVTVDRRERSRLFFPESPARYHILELDKFELNEKQLYTVDSRGTQEPVQQKLCRWLRFFKDGARENFMTRYGETDTDIAEAKKTYENFISDEQARDAEFRHRIYLMDRAQEQSDARREAKREDARNMKRDGLPAVKIAEYTGLSEDEIAGL